MRLRGPAEAASQAALIGLACCFQERCQVRLRCPARWSCPDPATLAGSTGGGGGSTYIHLVKYLPPDLIHAPHQYPVSHPFKKILCKDPSDF